MNWLATKIGLGIIFLNLLALLHVTMIGAVVPGGTASTTLFAVPALLAADLARYMLRCWRYDCFLD